MNSASASAQQDTARLESRRTRILDAAEKLFAEHGYDGVTLRAIAREADVDVALANYHFGRKHELFEATFMRRAELLNRWRIKALDEAFAAAAPNPPSVRAIMDAYLYPILHGPHITEPAWRSYYALVAYVNNSTEWGGKLMSRFKISYKRGPTAELELLSDLPDQWAIWCNEWGGAECDESAAELSDRSISA